MTTRSAVRLYVIATLLSAFALIASPAQAQFQPRPLNDPATGEKYHVEAAAGFWFPSADVVVASAALGIQGTSIDLKKDFSLQDKRFPEIHLELKASRRSKLRLQYIPIKYDPTATLSRDIVFNGIRYRIGLPVNAVLDWKSYRFGFEYDVVATDSGFAGFVIDAKYTDLNVQLNSPIANEFAEAKAPIPTIGGVGRFYIVPSISVTAEVTGFKLSWLPSSLIKNSSGHYVDVDVYGTLNFTNNIGVQLGYRSFDVGYVVKTDTASLKLKGIFFGVVARI